jgi:hypothetical protein
LRKATISFVLSVCMEQLGYNWTDFHEVFIVQLLSKISLKSDMNNRYFTWRRIYIYDNLAEVFLKWEMLQTKVVGEIKTHCVFSNFPKIVSFVRQCGKMWRKQRGHRWQYNTAHAPCMSDDEGTNADTHTRRICNTDCFSTARVVSWTRLDATLYVHCLSCYWLSAVLSGQ